MKHLRTIKLRRLALDLSLLLVRSSCHSIRKYYANCQRMEAINSSTYLWHLWTTIMTSMTPSSYFCKYQECIWHTDRDILSNKIPIFINLKKNLRKYETEKYMNYQIVCEKLYKILISINVLSLRFPCREIEI